MPSLGGARRTLRELRTERRWVLWLEPPRGAVRAYTQPIARLHTAHYTRHRPSRSCWR